MGKIAGKGSVIDEARLADLLDGLVNRLLGVVVSQQSAPQFCCRPRAVRQEADSPASRPMHLITPNDSSLRLDIELDSLDDLELEDKVLVHSKCESTVEI